MRFLKAAMVSALVVFMSASIHSQHGGGGAEIKFNDSFLPPCEIALVLDESASVSHPDFSRMLDIVRRFPDVFRMADNESRVAIVMFAEDSRIVLSLTANASFVRSFNVTRSTEWLSTATHLALEDIRDNVFTGARHEAVKIVIMITDGKADNESQTERVAEQIRADGSLIYLAFVGSDYNKNEGVRNHTRTVADDSEQVFPIDNFDKLTEDIFKKIKRHILCRFEEICRFADDQQTCTAEHVRPPQADNDPRCDNKKPQQTTRQCRVEDCIGTCSKWEWKEEPKCRDKTAGMNLTIERNGPRPPGSIFETCPSTRPGPSCPPAERPEPVDQSETKLADWVIALIAILAFLVLALILAIVLFTIRRRRQRERAAEIAKKKAQAKKAATKSGVPSTGFAHDFAGGAAADRSMAVSLALDPRSVASVSKSMASGGMQSRSSGGPKISGPSKSVSMKPKSVSKPAPMSKSLKAMTSGKKK